MVVFRRVRPRRRVATPCLYLQPLSSRAGCCALGLSTVSLPGVAATRDEPLTGHQATRDRTTRVDSSERTSCDGHARTSEDLQRFSGFPLRIAPLIGT